MFDCPYLHGTVELTDERRRHIVERHPELPTDLEPKLAETLSDPDQVRLSARFQNARLFSRWYNDMNGKYVVVVVVSDFSPSARHWIVTAYCTRSLAQGTVEWQKS